MALIRCGTCRASHLKCSGGQPCTTCKRRGVTCVYPQTMENVRMLALRSREPNGGIKPAAEEDSSVAEQRELDKDGDIDMHLKREFPRRKRTPTVKAVGAPKSAQEPITSAPAAESQTTSVASSPKRKRMPTEKAFGVPKSVQEAVTSASSAESQAAIETPSPKRKRVPTSTTASRRKKQPIEAEIETEAEAMSSVRSAFSTGAEKRIAHFTHIDISALEPVLQQEWQEKKEEVHALVDLTEEGLEWDIKGLKRKEIRRTILELRALQKERAGVPEYVEAMDQLVHALLLFHDLYEQLGICMSSVTGLRLALDTPHIEEEWAMGYPDLEA
ncbi:hypothetical protein BDV95DRAFT_165675 [Massariosphaeria phaeospora]|uniref:Zn(2)-C6 fungal-type domain-containing protein n=1 Tax=Massariosphaeria phaeospora TaxID=100035 RepID=A0A7C8I124_9PLEO|nr:hypothetical protein BDV95DRAFT_165675 [Massariosphaeria phaeospora]